eukprot:5681620-Ditylum_brightwellii.AAC.1
MMRIAKKFLKKAIQVVATKKPLIAFEVDTYIDQKIGESRTYKFCMQPEEDSLPVYSLTIEVFELGCPEEWLILKHQVKQVLKGQNIRDMDAVYTLVQDLLKGDALMTFNNKQAMFKEQMTNNLEKGLNAMM